MNANHTSNILVYCLSGTEFRMQLLFVIDKHNKLRAKHILKRPSELSNKENSFQTLSKKRQLHITTPRIQI